MLSLTDALKLHRTKTAAAQALGIPYTTFRNRLERELQKQTQDQNTSQDLAGTDSADDV